MSSRIRIGAVSYLNARPLVFGMEQGLGRERLELSYDVPSRLADRIGSGELDVALMPVIELASRPLLELVPGLGIVTRGPARSVLLVSRQPAGEIESVSLDRESRTSNALAQVLLERVWKRRPRLAAGPPALDEALDGFDAVVRIGDKALFEPIPPGCHVYDLGGVWTAETGLPFVFAAWFARPGVVDRELYRVLHGSRAEGSRVLDWIAEDYTWNGRREPRLSRDYLEHNIHFGLGGDEVRGMRLFFEFAAEAGAIASPPAIRFALSRRTACHEAAERPA